MSAAGWPWVTLSEMTVGGLLAAAMFAIAATDWRHYRVPDTYTAFALLLRAVDVAFLPGEPGAALDTLLRAGVMAGLFYLFREGYRRWRGREGLGLGDVKLAAVAGAWVEWRLLPYVIEIAALAGLGVALLRVGAGLRGDTKLPFAVGFAPAIWIGWWLGRIGY